MTHLSIAVLSAVLQLYLWKSARMASPLCKAVMNFGFAGLLCDNLILASGKYLGEGEIMRWLSKLRTISHVMTIPLLSLPVIETAAKSGLLPARAAKISTAAVLSFVIREVIDWIKFDARDMVLVDNRDSKEHAPHAMAGTMY